MTKLFVLEGKAENWEEALQQTSSVLLDNGCVTEDFYESCAERERVYPTGLTEYCPVALPHTSKDHVIKQAICALRLAEPAQFYSMDGSGKTINVNVVLNLAFLDDTQHIEIISRIIRALKEDDFVKNLTELPIDDFKDLIYNKFLSE